MHRFRLVTYSLALWGLLCVQSVSAQLKAGFSADKTGGCAPLAVSFTNTTSGASAAAVYQWDFGNGNTAVLKDPGAVFQQAKTYTVTLTVTDSGRSSVKTGTVTVYKKPTVDFSAALKKGCAPLPVPFTTSVAAGDGTVTGYFWDFGDGITEAASENAASHTYTVAQTVSASLTVTNSYGCQSTELKQHIITVLPELKASFQADKPVLCAAPDATGFKNTTTGPGTLAYAWKFGDGESSTVKEPVHTFTSRGRYTVKLVATSSEGCTAEAIRTDYINVADFKTDFEAPALICQETYVDFINKSAGMPDVSFWDFGDGYSYNTGGAETMPHNYYVAKSYTVTLTNTFGACKETVSKTVVVKEKPKLKGFVVDSVNLCNKLKVDFKDTSAAAVKWTWTGEWPAVFTSSSRSASYTYTGNTDYYVSLAITDAAGCTATVTKIIPVREFQVAIHSPETTLAGDIRSCGPQPIHFYTTGNVELKGYVWDFGDGSTATDATPVHTYTKPGEYKVRLSYTTASGCNGTTELYYHITVRDKVKADFKASMTDVCGNTPVTFTNLSGETVYYYWNFGEDDFGASVQERHTFTRQFQKEGLYTIRLIATDWVCADTMVKKAYIKVAPPFPKITGFTNTCEGTRGTVTFSQASKQTDSWTWDFGDGSTVKLTTNQPEIKHTYAKTGWYKVVLTNVNGACTVKDSTYVTVLLKQNPVLSADKKEVCTRDEYLTLTYSNLELNPSASNGMYGYNYGEWQYKDGTYYEGTGWGDVADGGSNGTWLSHVIRNFNVGHSGMRAVVTSVHFGCTDTTNSIPLKLKGPIPSFKVKATEPCKSSQTVYFENTSVPQDGIPVQSSEWYFSDGPWETHTEKMIRHDFGWGGVFHVEMIVRDAKGCGALYIQDVAVQEGASLKAAFTPSATTVSPGTTVTFTNTSATTDEANTVYKWTLGNGTTLTALNAAQTFAQPGTYTVKLVATNKQTGCSDSAKTRIIVKAINAAFTLNTTYISESKCPPVVVQFANTSSNTVSTFWDFGDGATAVNQSQPSHVYTKAGVYKITLVTYSDNGTKYTTVDSVVIREPAATLAADIRHGCTAQTISLTAGLNNTEAYLWDFGDGTLLPASDTFSKHHYGTAGVYRPSLIIRDDGGCMASVPLADPIVIDSLYIALNEPQKICTPKELFQNPIVVSVAADQEQQDLRYHWDFGTGNAGDTANIKTPSFTYTTPGTYTLRLRVQSPYGCVKEATAVIQAFQGLGGRINGPAEICQEATAQFSGATQIPGSPRWQWLFHDGTTANGQNGPEKKYAVPGTYAVRLVVDNNGCMDTLSKTLEVHPKPAVTLSPKEAVVCEGSQLTLTAGGGALYSWSPATGLSSTTNATVSASPVANTTYTVTVTNAFGCMNQDKAVLTVAHPFTLQVPGEATVCRGSSVQLTASGAASYQWIDNTATLSNAAIANPTASPERTTIYKVTGADSYHCFTDTAIVNVTVQPLPAIDAGPAAEILTGTAYQLKPVASSDVVKWTWSPAGSLSCSTCAAPEARPTEAVIYNVTVATAAGCTASDTVSVKVFCSGSRVFVPTAFTPNNDGLNDGFLIKGEGIRTVKALRIYNRWGTVVFERRNVELNSQQAAWNGTYKGLLVPIGSYVYFVEMECNGQTFAQKGTVTVVY